MRQVPNANRRLDDHVLRALNKIRRPSTAEEITELLNLDLVQEIGLFGPEKLRRGWRTPVTRY